MTARIPDYNGWFEIQNNPISKVGVFKYRGRSIGAPDPDRLYNVYRSAAELSDPETLQSFRLLPWINDHVMLGKGKPGSVGYVPAEKKGVHGVLGEQITFDHASGTMLGNIKVFSETLEQTIDGGKVDLSLGYNCKYIPARGTFDGEEYEYKQVHIRGNHIATVKDGRMNTERTGNDVAVMDEFATAFDWKELEPMSIDKAAMDAAIAEAIKPVTTTLTAINAALVKMQTTMDEKKDDDDDDDFEDETGEDGKPVMDAATGKPKKKTVDGKPVKKMLFGKPAMDAAIEAATKPLREQLAALKTVTGTVATDVAAMDAAIIKATKPLTDQIEAMKNNAMKNVVGEISKRNELAERLSHFVGTFDHSEMTLQDVALYGVKKAEIPTVVGQEVSAVNAWLHGRKIPRPTHAMDTAATPNDKSSVSKYLTGVSA